MYRNEDKQEFLQKLAQESAILKLSEDTLPEGEDFSEAELRESLLKHLQEGDFPHKEDDSTLVLSENFKRKRKRIPRKKFIFLLAACITVLGLSVTVYASIQRYVMA